MYKRQHTHTHTHTHTFSNLIILFLPCHFIFLTTWKDVPDLGADVLILHLILFYFSTSRQTIFVTIFMLLIVQMDLISCLMCKYVDSVNISKFVWSHILIKLSYSNKNSILIKHFTKIENKCVHIEYLVYMVCMICLLYTSIHNSSNPPIQHKITALRTMIHRLNNILLDEKH